MKKKLFCIFLFGSSLNAWWDATTSKKPLILNPSGDAQYTGRIIGKEFERTLTYTFAQKVQESLAEQLDMNVLLTRSNLESRSQRECAHFANCLQAQFFIQITFFQATTNDIEWYIYYYSQGTDFMRLQPGFTFLPVEHADILHKAETCMWAQKLAQFFKTAPSHQAGIVQGPFGLPLTSLKGIVPPAICIEIGLPTQYNVQDLASLLVKAIEQLPFAEAQNT